MNINQYILQNSLLNYQDIDSSVLKNYLASEDAQKYRYIISWPFHMLGQDANTDYSMKYEYAKKILNLTQSLAKTNYSAEEIEILAVYFIFYSSTWIRLDGDIEQLENYCSSAIQNKSTNELIIWAQQELKYNLLHLYSQDLENYRNGKIGALIAEIQQFITKHKDNLIIETIEE